MWLRDLRVRLRARLPVYKAIAALDARVQVVEQRLGIRVGAEDRSTTCPKCGVGRLVLVGERPHPLLGQAGVTTSTLKCDNSACDHVVLQAR